MDGGSILGCGSSYGVGNDERSGGIWLYWDNDYINLGLIHYSQYHVDMEVTDRALDLSVYMVWGLLKFISQR